MKTIALTSTTGGAGRTTLAAALAVLLARRGRPVVVVPPEPVACATTAARLGALRAGRGALQIVVNRLNPARDMQRDALAMLRAVAGPASMLEQRIHVDAAMPEALARGSWIFDDAPYSQALHDLNGVANWVDTWLKAAVAGRAGAAR
ncbi:hypothetical protein CFB81_16430 [Burkholderia sp. AU28863]|uniref:cellulose synthase operon protein YhjQ/BcsQ n=1 Tax=Burkholderia sp. AU28863 TaxID=2015352 RepID=UPI000B7AC918|nr:cellulose synthase operon protein YhjQ/BcsQ [Burkholderia sp. AU28863]OXI70122.1 hypothetical protein CFB81_16430 [Burkholderia sp. AU28863]